MHEHEHERKTAAISPVMLFRLHSSKGLKPFCRTSSCPGIGEMVETATFWHKARHNVRDTSRQLYRNSADAHRTKIAVLNLLFPQHLYPP